MESDSQDQLTVPRYEIETAPPTATRRIGFLQGQGSIGPEFFDPLPEEELRLWNCEDE